MKDSASKRIRVLLCTVRKRRALSVIAGGVAFTALVMSVAWVGQRVTAPDGPPAAPASVSAQPAPVPAAGFVEFRQPRLGIGLDYPADWARVEPADAQVALLLAKGSEYSFQLRTVELAKPVGSADLAAARQVTDEIVMSSRSVTMLAQPTQIMLAGLPGYFYFYTFTDPGTGQLGAHSHYFLFKGHTMITLVFQAIPTDRFRPAAGTFDRIAESFRTF